MKKIILFGIGISFATSLMAQKVIRHADGSYFKQCARFRITEPISKIAAEHPSLKMSDGPIETADKDKHHSHNYNKRFNPKASTPDPVIQRTQGGLENKAPLVSVNGQSSLLGYVPLDPNGMIGSNYYVQTINSNYAVYNKNGTIKLAATDMKNIFGAFTCDDGDPVTMYDKFADRWIITEFQENSTCGTFQQVDTLMMAVSVTNDPTGQFFVYYFCPDNADFTDYPKYSIWADGYYQTCNCSNDKVTVYDRTKMLNGDTSAGFIVMPFNDNPWNNNGQGGFFCPMTMYADGQLPPYGSPNYLMFFNDDNWGAGFTDELVIEKVAIDWTTKTGALTQYQTLPTAPFNSYFSGGTENDIDQPAKLNYFDALDGFISYRIPYLRWGNYNAAVMCYPVNVSPTPKTPTDSIGTELAGIRWYELRQDATSMQWSIYQQGTYAPNDSVNRWNPSIAMDQNGAIGLCYSVSDKTSTYPGARYTGRTSCDTLGKMTLTEGIGVSGTGGTMRTGHRWGDYSHTSVDPIDGITFWHTNMYDNGGKVATRIFSFQVPKCIVGIAGISAPQVELTAFQSGSMLSIKATGVSANAIADFDIYDVQGKLIVARSITTNSSAVETSFNVSSLAKGIYYVRLGNDNFQRVIKVPINL